MCPKVSKIRSIFLTINWPVYLTEVSNHKIKIFNFNQSMWVSESAIKGPFWAQICFIVIAFFLASGGIAPRTPSLMLHGKVLARVLK